MYPNHTFSFFLFSDKYSYGFCVKQGEVRAVSFTIPTHSGNGQERETQLNPSITSAEYWMYDGRLRRRRNVDPVLYPWHGGYTCFNSNQIMFADPLGIYGTKKRAEKMKERAENTGLETGPIYKQGKDYRFTTFEWKGDFDKSMEILITRSKTRYLGSIGNKVKDFLIDINPVKSTEGYVNWNIKTQKTFANKVSIKISTPIIEQQFTLNSNGEYKYNKLTPENSYLSIKYLNTDVRYYFAKGLGGDYGFGLRVLTTLGREVPLIIYVEGIPLYIADTKAQIDFKMDSDFVPYLGSRINTESPLSIPTPFKKTELKAEVNFGFKLKLKLLEKFFK
jgi:hypothetical protein